MRLISHYAIAAFASVLMLGVAVSPPDVDLKPPLDSGGVNCGCATGQLCPCDITQESSCELRQEQDIPVLEIRIELGEPQRQEDPLDQPLPDPGGGYAVKCKLKCKYKVKEVHRLAIRSDRLSVRSV